MNPYQFPFLIPTPTPIDSSHEVLNRILDVVTSIDNRLTNIENRLEDLESRLPQPQQPQQLQPEQLPQPLLQQQQPQQEEEDPEMNFERICKSVARTFVLVNPIAIDSGCVLSEPDTTSVLKKHVISDFCIKVTSEGPVYAADLYNSMLGEAATHKNPRKFSHIPQPIRNREIIPIDQCEKHWVGKYFIYNLFKSYNRSSSKGNERGDVSSMTTRDDASSIGATRLRLLGISSQLDFQTNKQLPSSPSNSSHATSFSIPSSLTPSSSTPSSSIPSSSAPSTGSQARRKRKASQQAFPVSVRVRNQSNNQ
ncbi:hypothetical protein BDC45DRAFT_597873 [Circinella umbellata]|nr:hypothetical protein BDC45DRAFT_597873 [Circinella umbellata]